MLWNWSLQVLIAIDSSTLNSMKMPQIAILAFVFLGEGLTARISPGWCWWGFGQLLYN